MNAPPTIHFRNIPLRRIGGLFPLSAPSPDDHHYYQVQPLAGGGFVAIWTNSPDDIRAQRLDANGMQIGAEIVINTQDAGTQSNPYTATLAGGGFVVTWNDAEGDAGTGTNGHAAVKAQVFSAGGDKVGAEILVNSAIDGVQAYAKVTALANGNFLVVWNDGAGGDPGSQGVGGAGGDASGTAVKAQLFAADGSRIGGEILVNTTTDKDQGAGYAVALADGGFAVAWSDYSQSHSFPASSPSDVDVRAQMFDPAGAKRGPELVFDAIETVYKTSEFVESITRLGNGNVLILSTTYFYSDFVTGPSTIRAQIATPAGVEVSEFIVHPSNGIGPEPLVQVLPGGGFVVAWTEDESRSNNAMSWVRAQLYADDGTKIGGQVEMPARGWDNQLGGLAAFANGEIAIMYVGRSSGSPLRTYVQLLDSHLHPAGDPALVATDTFGRLAFATPDGRMLMTTGDFYYATNGGQLLALDGHVPAAETVPFDLRGQISIGDADAGAVPLTLILSVPSGTLDVRPGGSGASVSGTGTGSVTIFGTLAQIEALLGGLSGSSLAFLAASGSPATVVLTASLNDNGNGGGAPQTSSATLAIDVALPASVQHGTPAADGLAGGAGINALYGHDGNDALDGRAGNDLMDGGAGSDTYYVDSAGDVVVDDPAAAGSDRVLTAVSYILPADAGIEILQPSNENIAPIELTGNDFGQTIIGNGGDDILRGNGGDDILYGGRGGGFNGDGADQLFGGAGDDYLIGSTGNDRMEGGAGSDTYYVDSAGDVIVEPVAVGNDRVAALASYALGADADIELFEAVNSTGTVAMNLTGNGFGQTIVGNAGVNRIDAGGGADLIDGLGGADVLIGGAGDDYLIGGSGADSLDGGTGSDVFYVDNASDVVIDAAAPGNDRVAASVSYTLGADADIEIIEAITLSATDAMNLIGNGFGQTIVANNGANTIDGKSGIDVLVGAGGADIFAFTTGLGSFNVDRIGDFLSGTDRIALDDAVFTGLAPGALPAGAFVIGSQAGDADDRIVYDSATGQLFFDADGSGAGAAVQFAILDGHPPVGASDFIVI